MFGIAGEVSVENLMSMPRAPEPVEAPPEAPKIEEEKELEPAKPIEQPRPAIVAPVTEPAQEKPAHKIVVQEEAKDVPMVKHTAPPPAPSKEEEPLPPKVEEPKEKKSRFGLFGGKKKTDEDRRKEEEEKRRREQERAREEEEKARLEEEERQRIEKEREAEKKKRKEDKDTGEQEDKVIYLTDEDIEDLLK